MTPHHRLTPSLAHLVLLLLLAGCRSGNPFQENHDDLRFALLGAESVSDRGEVIHRLNRVLVNTQTEPETFALQRFYAAFLLAQIHATASLEAPFLTEATVGRDRIEGIGSPRRVPYGQNPSTTAHLMATIYHASYARSLHASAAVSEAEADEGALIPDELSGFDLDRALANLQILMTTAYARMGFREEAAEILADSPKLLEPESCLSYGLYANSTEVGPGAKHVEIEDLDL